MPKHGKRLTCPKPHRLFVPEQGLKQGSSPALASTLTLGSEIHPLPSKKSQDTIDTSLGNHAPGQIPAQIIGSASLNLWADSNTHRMCHFQVYGEQHCLLENSLLLPSTKGAAFQEGELVSFNYPLKHSQAGLAFANPWLRDICSCARCYFYFAISKGVALCFCSEHCYFYWAECFAVFQPDSPIAHQREISFF